MIKKRQPVGLTRLKNRNSALDAAMTSLVTLALLLAFGCSQNSSRVSDLESPTQLTQRDIVMAVEMLGLDERSLVSKYGNPTECYQDFAKNRALHFSTVNAVFEISGEFRQSQSVQMPFRYLASTSEISWAAFGVSRGMSRSEVNNSLGTPSSKEESLWRYRGLTIQTLSGAKAFLTIHFSKLRDEANIIEFRINEPMPKRRMKVSREDMSATQISNAVALLSSDKRSLTSILGDPTEFVQTYSGRLFLFFDKLSANFSISPETGRAESVGLYVV